MELASANPAKGSSIFPTATVLSSMNLFHLLVSPNSLTSSQNSQINFFSPLFEKVTNKQSHKSIVTGQLLDSCKAFDLSYSKPSTSSLSMPKILLGNTPASPIDHIIQVPSNVMTENKMNFEFMSDSPASIVLKPPHSYIGLIAMAILSCTEQRKTLSEIYGWIAENYPYFRWRGTGWRNSIRHNLSLNDCFVKVNRASNGKGHYWAIHPANLNDFMQGDFRRKQAQWKVKSHFVVGQAMHAALANINVLNLNFLQDSEGTLNIKQRTQEFGEKSFLLNN